MGLSSFEPSLTQNPVQIPLHKHLFKVHRLPDGKLKYICCLELTKVVTAGNILLRIYYSNPNLTTKATVYSLVIIAAS